MAAIGPHTGYLRNWGWIKTPNPKLAMARAVSVEEVEVVAIGGVSLRVNFAFFILLLCIYNFLVFRKRDFWVQGLQKDPKQKKITTFQNVLLKFTNCVIWNSPSYIMCFCLQPFTRAFLGIFSKINKI